MKMKRVALVLLNIVLFYSIIAQSNLLTEITASSYLPAEKNHDYFPSNVFDSDYKTLWCEGSKNDGVNERITVNLTNQIIIDELRVYNGFNDERFYYDNNRVKVLELLINEISFGNFTLEDTSKSQIITFNDKIIVNKIAFVIKDVYKGNKWNDTCITEIELWNNKEKLNLDKGYKIYAKNSLNTLSECYINEVVDFEGKYMKLWDKERVEVNVNSGFFIFSLIPKYSVNNFKECKFVNIFNIEQLIDINLEIYVEILQIYDLGNGVFGLVFSSLGEEQACYYNSITNEVRNIYCDMVKDISIISIDWKNGVIVGHDFNSDKDILSNQEINLYIFMDKKRITKKIATSKGYIYRVTLDREECKVFYTDKSNNKKAFDYKEYL